MTTTTMKLNSINEAMHTDLAASLSAVEGGDGGRRPSRRRRRRRGTLGVQSNSSVLLLLFFCFLIAAVVPYLPSSSPGPFSVRAEEVVATDEWTELGPNDTIPAGLHVKIDMSTGRKFVKKVEEGELSDFDKGRMGVAVETVEVDADGTATVVEGGREGGEEGASSRGVVVTASAASSDTETETGSDQGEETDKKDGGGGDYDYLMMHRTLSNLPPDEMVQYGGLPELPAGLGTPSVTPEQRAHFEEKMRNIWTQRQALLREVQENHVADVASVVSSRIRVLAEYLEDPVGRRADIEERRRRSGKEEEDGSKDYDEEEGGVSVVRDVLDSLEDLEYQLSDLDLARDFHTLGGWPLTVALLSDSVHCPQEMPSSANATIAAEDSESNAARLRCLEELSSSSEASAIRSLVDEIQSKAAWAAGTAVKNNEEFHGWALEDFSELLPAAAAGEGKNQPVTAVSLLLSDYLSSSSNPATATSSSRKARRQKGLYALGALVRGNSAAQSHFLELGGPAVLADVLTTSLGNERGGGGNSDVRFASRVLALGYDLLTDVRQQNESNGGEGDGKSGEALAAALSSGPWCDAAVRLSSPSANGSAGISVQIREKALEAMTVLADRCGYGEAERSAVVKSRAEWLVGGGRAEEDDDYLDPSYRNDLVALADAALGAIDGGAAAEAR